jgi:uncharacterized protein with PIN domain
MAVRSIHCFVSIFLHTSDELIFVKLTSTSVTVTVIFKLMSKLCRSKQPISECVYILFEAVAARLSSMLQVYTYCAECRKAWHTCSECNNHSHPLHCSDDSVEFSGIDILYNYVSEDEEASLCTQIDEVEWKPSQSGRLKQVMIFYVPLLGVGVVFFF